MTDPIADMLIRIKNAQMAKKESVFFDYSKIKLNIAQLLEREGWISDVQRKGKKNIKVIEGKLIYLNGAPKISGVRRISLSSRRIYRGYKEAFSPRNGLGMAVYSTPRGILSDREVRKTKVGGEVLFEIW